MGRKRLYNIGDVYEVPSGKFEVIGYADKQGHHLPLIIKWLDDFGHVQQIRSDVIQTGSIKNPYYPSVQGAGFIGSGKYSTSDRERYTSWGSMIARCYREKFKERNPSYLDCSCVIEWNNYQNYCEFYENDVWRKSGWHLDKDLLVRGNKIYSPETCVYLPQELNSPALSFKETKNKYGYKNVGLCPNKGEWMSVVYSDTTGNGRTTGGRFTDIRDAAINALEGEISKLQGIINKFDGKIDVRAISAYHERVAEKISEIGDIKNA